MNAYRSAPPYIRSLAEAPRASWWRRYVNARIRGSARRWELRRLAKLDDEAFVAAIHQMAIEPACAAIVERLRRGFTVPGILRIEMMWLARSMAHE